MHEREMLSRLARGFRRSPRQLNAPSMCDAEVVMLGEDMWAFTMDEFSRDEDLLDMGDPALLGWNLAVATLSDLYAAGAVPEFFLNSTSLPDDIGVEKVDGMTSGISTALKEAGCYMLGGDLGRADDWRFCGVAFGKVPAGRPVTRTVPRADQIIWMSGRAGDANLAAFTGSPGVRFELRRDIAELVRRLATACIDTSGGVLDAAWCLKEASPGVTLNLQVDRVPLAPGVAEAASSSGMPKETVLVAGAGEYELLFTTPAGLSEEDARRLDEAGATRVGASGPGDRALVVTSGHHSSVLENPPPDAREAADIGGHAREAARFAAAMLGIG